MARLSRVPSPEQAMLPFPLPEALAQPVEVPLVAAEVSAAPDAQPALGTEQVDGVAVSVEMRAVELVAALKALNQANSRAGMQAANATPHRAEFEKRYGPRGADIVVEGTRSSEEWFIVKSRTHFVRAAGRDALLAAGYSPAAVAKSMGRLFDAFTAMYGVGITSATVRNAKATKIQRSADIITGKRSPNGRRIKNPQAVHQ